jgi:predicted deacylase
LADDQYPLQLTPPDISAYRAGNTGIPYVTTLDSGKPGPHVMVAALVHGNELCGAIAVDYLCREGIKPAQGKLTLAFCNVAAFERFDRARPTASRFVDEDFNRVWSPEVLDGKRRSTELARARELRPMLDTVDYLLDIHSMQHPTDALMLCGPLEKGRRFAHEVGYPALIVSDAGHAAGRRMRDYGGFGDKASPKNALLVECGQHWAKSSADVAKETMLRFLVHLKAIKPEHLPKAKRPAPKIIEVTEAVTIRSDAFSFTQDFKGLEVIARRGTEIGRDGATPVTTPYDDCVLIMPSRRLDKGQTAVRLGRYVAVSGAP